MAVGVQTKQYGVGKGRAPDLSAWEQNARQLAPKMTGDKPKVVVELSTVAVRAAQLLAEIIPACGATCPVEVMSNPAFISSGTAVRDLLEPERILLGSSQSEAALVAVEKIASIYETWVPKVERLNPTPLSPSPIPASVGTKIVKSVDTRDARGLEGWWGRCSFVCFSFTVSSQQRSLAYLLLFRTLTPGCSEGEDPAKPYVER